MVRSSKQHALIVLFGLTWIKKKSNRTEKLRWREKGEKKCGTCEVEPFAIMRKNSDAGNINRNINDENENCGGLI